MKFIDAINVIVALVNIYFVYLVYLLTRKDINPKLYISPVIENAGHSFDKEVNSEILDINFNTKGFPEIDHDTLLWKFEIHNNGDLPATNVEVEYSIVIKKAVFNYGIDEADIINVSFVDFKKINRTVKFDYIPPNSERVEKVLFVQGNFPYADLIINKLKSKERKFIEKPILIQTYEHPELLVIQDSHHYRQILGVYNED